MSVPLNSSAGEDERVRALRDHHILDTPAEHEFDNIAKLAGLICNAPIALISMVDEARIFVKSLVGASAGDVPREMSFSEHTIRGDDVLEVADTTLDSRFLAHPSVAGEPHIRFYAGAPLIDGDGYKLGVLGVFDTKPRRISPEQKEGLQVLAREIITHIALRRKSVELEAKTARFEEMLNLSTVSPEIHCILDRLGNLLFINDAVTSILGYTAAEATGLNMWGFCDQEDVAVVLAEIEAGLRAGKKHFQAEFRIRSKTGQISWLSWNMVAKGDRWYAYGRDITENRKVQAELTKLSLVASKVNNAVVINNADNQVTWVNTAFEQITGYTLDDLKGRQLGDLISGPGTDLQLLETAREMTRQHKSFAVDILGYRKDGSPIWLSVYNTVVLNKEGNAEFEVEIIIDITEKKEAEREMTEAREKAIQLGEAKEMLLSVMSHEIRTPLNAVIGMTHLLLGNDPKPSQLADLNILRFSAESLLGIINDILDFTKIESGNMQLESMPFCLRELAMDIVESMQRGASEKGNKLGLSFDNRVPDTVMGDKTRLYQVLMNLLGNAVKFTTNGVVALRVRLEEENDQYANIHFEVEDSGIGIPQDKLSYIFETFTQADTDISRKYGGTGLGLAITKKLLGLFGTEIAVQSRIGEGTTFSFDIRFKKAETESRMIPSRNEEQIFSGSRILVVDDNEVNILVVVRMLNKWGIETESVNSGELAIEKVKQQHYDLIFMDIYMPGLDGFETSSIVRAMEGEYFRRVPIVALTASGIDVEEQRFKASGMNGYILKPFRPAEIKTLISGYLLK
ncbi:PAS domain S-box protein [Pedobacter sp. JY14-1]|uniref:PAS domain S-box protein n=1 Tax=Pedobacter sp. JY14-1 TaxID=3034151 RepID=UPI0023E1C488|nr:PAS domain S-box protein [Pedobacter sp. JY14-1]